MAVGLCLLTAGALDTARTTALAGIADTPLPQFADGKASVPVLSVSGVVKRDRLETDFLCTSLDSSPVDIGVEVFGPDGTLVNNVTAGVGAVLNVNPGQTVTIGTSATATYLESAVIPPASVAQGSARVVASSPQVRCNVVIVDDAVTPPVALTTLDAGVQLAAGAAPPTVPLPQFSNGHLATHAAVFAGAVKRDRAESAVSCTSLASAAIDVGVEVFAPNGTVANSVAAGNGAILNVAPGATVTFATTGTVALLEDAVITLPAVAQGLLRVVSNSAQVLCSAGVLDAALSPPTAMSNLRGSGAGSPGAGPSLSSPLPQFSDGKPSLHIMTVPGVMKRDRLETDFLCTSVGSSPVDIGVQIFAGDGTLQNDVSAGVGAILNVAPGQTVTIGTTTTATLLESTVIPTPNGLQGSGRIVASSDKVRCNVMVLDDLLTPPVALGTLFPGVQLVAGAAPSTLPLPQFSDGAQATHALLVPGVVKRGNVETDVLCTSLATTSIDVGVQVLRPDGTVANSIAAGNGALLSVAPGSTVTFGTTGTAALLETTVIVLPGIAQGAARVVSNSDQLICSALVLDAALSPPGAMSALVGYGVTGGPVPPTATPTMAPTPTPTPVCGDGVVQGGEQCDDGNLVNGDGCDATCNLECPGTVTEAKLIIAKIDTPPGDDKLTFKGLLTLPAPIIPPVDPPSTGVQVLVDGAGGVVAGVGVLSGAAGWSSNAQLTKWLFKSDPLKVIIKASPTAPGVFKFKANAKGGAFGVSPSDLPVTVYVVLAPGQCGKVALGSPSAPSCGFNAAASKLKCK